METVQTQFRRHRTGYTGYTLFAYRNFCGRYSKKEKKGQKRVLRKQSPILLESSLKIISSCRSKFFTYGQSLIWKSVVLQEHKQEVAHVVCLCKMAVKHGNASYYPYGISIPLNEQKTHHSPDSQPFDLNFLVQEAARYRLKYCLKGPLNPKQPTNQPSYRRTNQGITIT